jgi:hypothetical protein
VFDTEIWEEFQKEARKRRRNPVNLAAALLREQLEVWQDEKLDRAIKRDVQRSGYTEDDAVEIVRQYRLEKKPPVEKKRPRAAS